MRWRQVICCSAETSWRLLYALPRQRRTLPITRCTDTRRCPLGDAGPHDQHSRKRIAMLRRPIRHSTLGAAPLLGSPLHGQRKLGMRIEACAHRSNHKPPTDPRGNGGTCIVFGSGPASATLLLRQPDLCPPLLWVGRTLQLEQAAVGVALRTVALRLPRHDEVTINEHGKVRRAVGTDSAEARGHRILRIQLPWKAPTARRATRCPWITR